MDPQFRLQLESVYEALENGKVPFFCLETTNLTRMKLDNPSKR